MAKPPDRIGHSLSPRRLISPINVSDLKTYPLKKRHSKVRVSDFAKPWRKGGSFSRFYRALPDILAVKRSALWPVLLLRHTAEAGR